MTLQEARTLYDALARETQFGMNMKTVLAGMTPEEAQKVVDFVAACAVNRQ